MFWWILYGLCGLFCAALTWPLAKDKLTKEVVEKMNLNKEQLASPEDMQQVNRGLVIGWSILMIPGWLPIGIIGFALVIGEALKEEMEEEGVLDETP